MAIDYKDIKKIKVRHIPSGETYDAILLDDRDDNSIIFELCGPNARFASIYFESDNLEVDTLFNDKWEKIK